MTQPQNRSCLTQDPRRRRGRRQRRLINAVHLPLADSGKQRE